MAKRILVVEDDHEMRSMLIDFIQDEGYDVDSAENGLEALRKLTGATFDLVITDIRMPGLSGLDILPRLKKIQPGVSIIAITAFGGDEVSRKALQGGATGYLEKPIHLEKLRELIHDAVSPL